MQCSSILLEVQEELIVEGKGVILQRSAFVDWIALRGVRFDRNKLGIGRFNVNWIEGSWFKVNRIYHCVELFCS